MKKILCILLLFSIFSSTVYSQRALIDSTFTMTYGGFGNLIRGNKKIYTRNTDNTVDEIREYLLNEEKGTYYGWSRQRYTYDEHGRMTSEARWDGFSGDFDYTKSRNHRIYEYTDFGKLSRSFYMKNFMGERISGGYNQYYYTNERLDSIIRTYHNDESGKYDFSSKDVYKYYDGYYEVLNQSFNRDLGKFEDSSQTKYYEKNGKLLKKEIIISSQDPLDGAFSMTEYEYADNGYNTTEYEYGTPSDRYEYIFDEFGQEISQKQFSWEKNGKYWSLNGHWSTKIFYSNNITTNNSNYHPISENISIYSVQGSNILTIESNDSNHICIYSLSGNLIKQQTAHQGSTEISLPVGVYIIKVGIISKKVIIR